MKSQSEDEENEGDSANRSYSTDEVSLLGRMKFIFIGPQATMNLILSIVFLDMVATGLVVPTIPYYSKRLDLETSTQGLLMSLYGTLQLLGSPILGRMSDRFGRKPGLLLSIVGTLVSYLLLSWSCNVLVLFLSRIIIGLFKNTETSCYSMVADISSPLVRVKRLAYIGSAVGLGFIIGPAISGVLTSNYSLETPTYLSCFLLLVTTLVTLVFLPESKFLMKVADFEEKASDLDSIPQTVHSPLKRTLDSKARGVEKINKEGQLDKPVLKEYKSVKVSTDIWIPSSALPASAKDSGLTESCELEGLNDEMIDELSLPVEISAADDLQSFSSQTRQRTVANDILSSDSSQEVPPHLKELERSQSTKDLLKLAWNPSPLRSFVWIYLATTLGNFIFQGSSSILFQHMGVSVQASSWLTAYAGTLTVLSSFVLHILSRRFTEQQLLSRSILILGVTLLLTTLLFMGSSLSLLGLLVAYIPLILASRTKKNCLLGLVTHQTPKSQTGSVIGLLNSLESLCRALTPLLGCLLMQASPTGPAFAGGMVNIIVYVIMSRTKLPT